MLSVTNTVVLSPGVRRSIATAQNQLATAMFQLSSGLRSPAGRNGASAAEVSVRLESQIRGLDEGLRRLSEGIAVAQSAEALLNSIDGTLAEMAEITVQAQEESLTPQARLTLQMQLTTLRDSISRNAEQDWGRTLFGEESVVPSAADGDSVGSADTDMLPSSPSATGEAGDSVSPSPIPTIDVSTPSAARTASQAVESARQQLGEFRVRVEQILGHLEASVTNLRMATESYATGQVRAVDDAFIRDALTRVKAQAKQESQRIMDIQANAHPSSVLVLLRPEK
jgi:flagellin-like hook-associated protein FlgL